MRLENFENIDRSTIYRTLVIVVSVAFILWGCLVILQPFIPAFLLAIIFTLSTWPAFVWLKDRLEGKRTLAAFLMTVLLAICFLVPLVFLGTSLADNFTRLYSGVIRPLLSGPTDMPVWLNDLPLIGQHIEPLWNNYIVANLQDTSSATGWLMPKLIATGAAIGRGVIDIALGILFAFFFFRHGVAAAAKTSALIAQFTGPRGQHLLEISKRTVIGVVYGVLGTAIAQGALAGIGFWIAGVPGAPFLGVVTLVLSFVPMGPPLIWLPAALWLFSSGSVGHGVFLTIWGLFIISGVDNIVRPYFISLGSSLPLLLVILGVFGGLLAFGFIGLFIGPTLLAVAYSLIFEWTRREEAALEQEAAKAE